MVLRSRPPSRRRKLSLPTTTIISKPTAKPTTTNPRPAPRRRKPRVPRTSRSGSPAAKPSASRRRLAPSRYTRRLLRHERRAARGKAEFGGVIGAGRFCLLFPHVLFLPRLRPHGLHDDLIPVVGAPRFPAGRRRRRRDPGAGAGGRGRRIQ